MTKESLAMLGSKAVEGLDQGGLKFVEGTCGGLLIRARWRARVRI
jgi:hypothetical protein